VAEEFERGNRVRHESGATGTVLAVNDDGTMQVKDDTGPTQTWSAVDNSVAKISERLGDFPAGNQG